MESEGDFFLLACPGSGKTRAAGARVARLADDGMRVAATSYTNIGVDQIRQVVTDQLGVTLGAEHFVGTLHGFFLRYVFFPFGHLAMGCSSPPRLVPDEARGWGDVVFGGDRRIRLPLHRFKYRPDGSLLVRSTPRRFPHSAERATVWGQAQARLLKKRAAAAGIASFDDAMYWALQVLRKHPQIRAAVAARFDELLVDEAQDISGLQLACIHELCDSGKLTSLVLVGDIEQSIYSFQGATPDRCQGLATARGLTILEFSENHRSSQRICDTAVRFCGRPQPDSAVGPDAGCPWPPELVIYPADDPARLIPAFSARLDGLSISVADAAVLTRRNDLVEEINGEYGRVDCGPALSLGRAAFALRDARAVTRPHIRAVDEILAQLAWGTSPVDQMEPSQRRRLRRATMTLLETVPPLDTDLGSWIRGSAKAASAVVADLTSAPVYQPGRVLRAKREHGNFSAREVFAPAAATLRAQTVHDIKGGTRDAVLVVAERSRSPARTPQGAVWSRHLFATGGAIEDSEELRIVFVAITRARRLCALALPDDTDLATTELFENAGFVRAHWCSNV